MKQSPFEQRVLEQLQHAVPITARKMFGCVGVYADDAFFAIIDDPQVYFKVDAQNLPAYQAHGSAPFSPYADGRQSKSFYQLPDDVLHAPDVLRQWVSEAIGAAQRKKR